MKSSTEWNTVTSFSKKLALFLFFLLPILGFFYGMYYQHQLFADQSQADKQQIAELQNQVELANTGRAQLLRSEVHKANAIKMPANSAMFADKDVTVRHWQFRGKPITEYEVALSTSSPIQVRMWEYLGEDTTRLVRIETDGSTTPLELGLDGVAPYLAKDNVQRKWNRYTDKLTTAAEPNTRHQIYVEIQGDEIPGLPMQKEGSYFQETTKPLEAVADSIVM